MDLDFLTPKEVAPLLRVSKMQISRMVKNKELPALRVGKQIRISRTDLEAWVQAQKEKARQ